MTLLGKMLHSHTVVIAQRNSKLIIGGDSFQRLLVVVDPTRRQEIKMRERILFLAT